MVGNEYSNVLKLQPRHYSLNVLNSNRVNTGKRLVKQNKLRIDSKRTRNLSTPTLPSAQHIPGTLPHMCKPEFLQQCIAPCSLLGLGHVREFQHRHNVILNTQLPK